MGDCWALLLYIAVTPGFWGVTAMGDCFFLLLVVGWASVGGVLGTEVSMQMHLAERDLDVAARNGRHINPVERGHIAFRTDDIEGFKQHLRDNGIAFADYGTAFAAEWYQIFFHDPEGNIIEVHQQVA